MRSSTAEASLADVSWKLNMTVSPQKFHYLTILGIKGNINAIHMFQQMT